MSVNAYSGRALPLAEYVWPRPVHPANMRASVLVVVGVLLLTLSAKIQVPLWPIPMTMQTLVVLTIGLTYGRVLALITLLAYLFAGALGLPVFAGTPERGIGVLYMVGSTGGFLLGFLAATFLMGFLAERGYDRTILRTALAMFLGNIVIFGCGFLWLSILMGIHPVTAWSHGVEPFLIGNFLQSLLAIAFLPAVWKYLHTRG